MDKSLIKEWFSVTEAAEYLRIAKKSIYNLHSSGLLKGFNSGGTKRGKLLFRKEHLDAYVMGRAS